jgi:hypothetical protein
MTILGDPGHDVGGQCGRPGHKHSKEQSADQIRAQDNGPEAECREQIAALVEYQRHRIQRVFGKQLRATDDHDDEADREEDRADETCLAMGGQRDRGGR